ncbi:MAG TPA: hypothetical protein VFP80_13655 [Thermoanaerobaculia bacterium]|nr:hypothetical protein [Thermoanaerobaculia bacterium]
MSCVTVDVLARIIAGEIPPDEQESTERHGARCARCAEKIAAARELASVSDVGSHIGSMREQIEAVVATLLQCPVHRWSMEAREAPYASSEVARRLLTMADDARRVNRRRAFSLADASVEAANAALAAGGDAGAALVLADALKMCSILFYESGSVALAFAALDRAEAALADLPHASNERARLLYARAYILSGADVWKPEEAEALLTECRRMWSELGNASALRDALELSAIIRHRAGDHAAALALLLPMLPAASAERRAALRRNVAVAALRLGDLETAERFTGEALAMDAAAGARVDVARDRWLRGCVAMERGRFEEALPDLQHARSVFHEDAQADTELRVRVDIVTATLGADPDADVTRECSRMWKDSRHLDERETSRARAFTCDALLFLREQAARRALTAADVAYVAAYLGANAATRAVPFVPPVPTRVM